MLQSGNTPPSQSTAETVSPPAETPNLDGNGDQPVSEVPRRGRPTRFFKQKRSPWPILLLGMLLAIGFVGWRVYSRLGANSDTAPAAETETEAPAAPAPLPVRAVRARRDIIQGWVYNPDGEVRALRGKHLTFEANGEVTYLTRIDGRFLREGDRVFGGQILAKVDDREYQANIRSAEADANVAQAEAAQAIAARAQAEAGVEKALSDLELARTEFRRRQELFAEGAIPASERDTYANAVDAAEADLKVAQQDVLAKIDAIAAAESSIDAAQAQLENARIALEDTELVSPIDGIIAYLNIREGDYWSTQRVQASGDYQDIIETIPIVVIDPNDFEVVVELTAEEGNRVRPGQEVYLLLEEDTTQAFISGLTQATLVDLARARGRVFSVNPAVTPGGRAVQVRIQVTEGLSFLRIGERVQAWIETDVNPSAVVLPPGAIVFRDRQPFIYVVNEAAPPASVEQRQIELGIEGLGGIEVRSGLEPGELVVTEGRNRLVSGTPVEVVEVRDEN